MGIGVSIFFITLGAILKFAIEPDVLGDTVHIDVIGVIFMIVGGVGLLLSIVFATRRGQTSDNHLMEHENKPEA
ncbi:hypothetical protein [Planotetraspora kaengkrachanensis]|uniref:Uncharacterized protein n=1 Tax=Planotetraspora kaengkrachanensis TaxID=575193 RepID=A0A8J3VAZ4_9ACTN|nr:hypothetical protein [Planotetraspora kaengkrachanensis]GIG83204.1 hypothetical protein Pka01_63310 [Planotetraspora kaengkrachanensis]